MTLEQALEKYAERFGECFPIMCMRGTPEAEIITLIEKALESGEPFALSSDDSEFPPLY